MFYALLSILLNAAAQLTIKSLAGTTSLNLMDTLKHWQLYATGLLYATSIITWFIALKNLPLNIAYPMQALGYVLVSVAAWALFGESLGLMQISGLLIIILGVLLLAFGVQ